MPEPLPCPDCGTASIVQLARVLRRDPSPSSGWVAVLCDCYDGAPDAGPQRIVTERSQDEAVEAWNDQIQDEKE
jgi:hypothetical protein